MGYGLDIPKGAEKPFFFVSFSFSFLIFSKLFSLSIHYSFFLYSFIKKFLKKKRKEAKYIIWARTKSNFLMARLGHEC